MNREIVLGAGVTPDQARLIGAFLRCAITPEPKTADATAMVNNEGITRGMIRAAELVETLAKREEKDTPTNFNPYSEPKN